MKYENLKIPNHVAIILDGNGRWAKKRGLDRSIGHKEGFENLKKLSNYIFESGINILSVYAFSTENFKRSKKEVDNLMDLFLLKFKTEQKYFKEKNIKIIFSGKKEPLNNKVWNAMKKITEITKDNTGGVLNICLNYGSHLEIIDATKKIIKDIEDKKLNINDLDEFIFNSYLYQNLPPIDLLIRTGGELRISNFMLWQISYSELYFTDTYFPDFNSDEFDKAIIDYNKRERRFGSINDKD